MAMICNECEIVGKSRQIWCKNTKCPCMHVRYCAVSMKYYQTDAAAHCKARTQNNGKNNEADENDRVGI